MTYTVDTPRSRRRFRWPRLPLGEGQAAWTTRALMLLAPLLSFTLVEYLNYNNPWTDFTSLQIALNLAWYYLGELFFYFVLRRRASAVKWAMGIAWGLGMANHYLISFRGRTLFPGDFLTLRTAANVAGNYDYRPDSMQWLTIGVFAALMSVIGVVLAASKAKRPLLRALGSAVCGAASLGAVNLLAGYTGVSIALNYATAFVAVVLGAPGVVTMLLLRVLLLF